MFLSFFISGLKKKCLSCFPEFQQKKETHLFKKDIKTYYKINNKSLLFHTMIYKNYEISLILLAKH